MVERRRHHHPVLRRNWHCLTPGGHTDWHLGPPAIVTPYWLPNSLHLVVLGTVDCDLLPVGHLLPHGLAGHAVVELRDDAGSKTLRDWGTPLKYSILFVFSSEPNFKAEAAAVDIDLSFHKTEIVCFAVMDWSH